MKFDTVRFGEIEVEDDKVITFTEGLLGFPNSRQYIILDHAPDSPFKWLQSANEPALAFVIIDPLSFKDDYRVSISPGELADLKLKRPDDAVVCVIVTIPRDNPQEMTANLQAPVVINPDERLARQVVLYEGPYTTKHKILSEIKQTVGQSVSAA